MRLNTISYYADFYINLALVVVLAGSAAQHVTIAQAAEWAICAGLGH